MFRQVDKTFLDIEESCFAEYKVSALDQDGMESFTSEPVLVIQPGNLRKYQFEDYLAPSSLPYTNYSGRGFVKLAAYENQKVQLDIDVEKAGCYLLDVRYANGTGPWNTDNNCAMRTLYINGSLIGSVVLPQRGTDEWSDWGNSNAYTVTLEAGKNRVELNLEEWNTNMDGTINEAMLDYLRLVKL